MFQKPSLGSCEVPQKSWSRLHPSSILTFNSCSILQHFFFEKTERIFFADIQFFQRFWNFTKIKSFWRHIFAILSINKPFLGSCEVPHKIWIRSMQPFYWIQTDKQTKKHPDTQASIYRWIYRIVYLMQNLMYMQEKAKFIF